MDGQSRGDRRCARSRRRRPERRKEELVCAGCHSRRGQFSDAPRDALHYYDAFHPSTLAPGLYYPDGQQRDEVYNFASFAQSRMHAAGRHLFGLPQSPFRQAEACGQ